MRTGNGLRAIASVVVGCALVVTLGGRAGAAEPSGFLNDYSKLQPNPRVEGTLLFLNPATPLKAYDKFVVDPIVVHFAPEAKGAGIDPNTLKELTDFFHGAVTAALTKAGYQVVTEPGPGVMRVRAAITDIKKAVPVANIHPLMKMSGIGLGGASMEAEGVDTQSNERVFAVVDSQSGSRMGITSGLQTYEHAKEVMTAWAQRLVARLDEAHGKPPATK